jgi:hypothetical protein
MAFEDFEDTSITPENKETPEDRLKKYPGWIEELSNKAKYGLTDELVVYSIRSVPEKGEGFELKAGHGDIEPEDYDWVNKGFVESMTVEEFVKKLRSDATGMYDRWQRS